jgi:hypothetical protein
MDFRRFLLSALLTGAVVLAAVRSAAALGGNYAISNSTETGNATFYDTITGYPPTPMQNVPVANATVEADGANFSFSLTASGTLPVINTQKAQPITGIILGNDTVLVTGPRGSVGNGTIDASGNMTLVCNYLIPGGRVTYHYVFLLVPSP